MKTSQKFLIFFLILIQSFTLGYTTFSLCLVYAKIIIKKYNPGCQCCGDMKDVKEYKGIKICKKCLNELNNK